MKRLVPLYAVVAALAFLIVGGHQVAPCLGSTEINGPCVAAWEARRTAADRVLETPIPYVLGFLLAVGLTAIVVAIRRSESYLEPRAED